MFLSRDGAWRVRPISINGVALLRVDRWGFEGWYWVEDVRTPGEIEKYVALDQLTEHEE